ncbi:cyclic pyranopterin monophosphate synthase-like [Montipora capricornis]|uniref:cyclic pyranopterin monophosphate synthase-like n=1 Tax=Montipora capricornis TaxID=246305 RepID=UPI0035F12187
MTRSRFCRSFKEVLKTANWQPSRNWLWMTYPSRGALFLESRRLAYTGSFMQLHLFMPKTNESLMPCQPTLTKSSEDSIPTVKPFHSGICSRSLSCGHLPEDKNYTQGKKDTPSASTKTVSQLSHVDAEGHARMVDVSAKRDTVRVAMATAVVYLGPKAFELVKEDKIAKGDVLTVAQLAGIMACKLTPSLIPLCHNIQITHSKVNLELDDEKCSVHITGVVNSVGRTGVEMECLTAVSVAALTVYDMCKAVSRDIVISDIKLVQKSGGDSGDYIHP